MTGPKTNPAAATAETSSVETPAEVLVADENTSVESPAEGAEGDGETSEGDESATGSEGDKEGGASSNDQPNETGSATKKRFFVAAGHSVCGRRGQKDEGVELFEDDFVEPDTDILALIERGAVRIQ